VTTLRFTRFTALFPYGYHVQWSLIDVPENVSGVFQFDLYRSGGPEGPWQQVLASDDQYAFLDKFNSVATTLSELQPNQMRLFQEVHYKLVCRMPNGTILETKEETGPANATRKMSQYLRKSKRDFRLTLKFNGTKLVVLKKRRWGAKCIVQPDGTGCYDPISQEVMRQNCRECWGTGFIGGYWTPFVTYGRRNVSANTSAITPAQRSDTNDGSFWLPDYPTLEADDILISLSDQRRFIIDQQVETQILLNSVHQEVACMELDHDHIIYQMRVAPDTLSPLY